MKIRPLGIRGRLTLSYILVFAALLCGFGIISYSVLKTRLDSALSDELTERAAALRGYFRFEDGGVTLSFNPNDPEEAYFVQVSTRYYQVYNVPSGMLLAQSQELHLLGLGLTATEVRALTNGPPFHDVQTDQVRLRFRNEVISAHGETYLFQIGASMQQMQDSLRHFFELLLWLIPASIAVASLVGWWAAARALRPVAILAASAEAIELSDLAGRLPVSGSRDELDHLARTFNDTFSRLANTLGEMRQFTASISHELRTPLSILRGEAEIALMQTRSEEDYRRVLASQLEECDKLTRMINQLLTLARAEGGEIRLEHKPVNLSLLVQSLVEQMEPLAESRGVRLGAHCAQESVIVQGDASWLERVILNLVDNAIKFSRPGGAVAVSVETIAGKGVFAVTDTGTGISSEAMPRIFERFYQADSARSGQGGAGLGLSLAKWVVDHHGGSIEVTSPGGGGSSFRVTLPRA